MMMRRKAPRRRPCRPLATTPTPSYQRSYKATFHTPMDAPQDMEEVYRLLCSAQALAAHDEDALRRLRHEITKRSLEVAR